MAAELKYDIAREVAITAFLDNAPGAPNEKTNTKYPQYGWTLKNIGDTTFKDVQKQPRETVVSIIRNQLHGKKQELRFGGGNTDTTQNVKDFKQALDKYVVFGEEDDAPRGDKYATKRLPFTLIENASVPPVDPAMTETLSEVQQRVDNQPDPGDTQSRQQTADAGTDAGGPNPDTETSIVAGVFDELSRTFRIPVADIRAIIQRDPMLTKTLKKLTVQRAVAVGSTLDQRKEALRALKDIQQVTAEEDAFAVAKKPAGKRGPKAGKTGGPLAKPRRGNQTRRAQRGRGEDMI